jgi:hypothetical protein
MNVVQAARKSRYLSKDEAGDGLTVTIDVVRKENVAPNGEKPEERCVLHFKDGIKPFILNSTNAKRIAKALGTEESNEWRGKEIELYHDPNVEFGGKLIGGIRARPVQGKQVRGVGLRPVTRTKAKAPASYYDDEYGPPEE